MICATKLMTTHHGRRSCRRWLAHSPVVLLGSRNTENKQDSRHVEKHGAAMAWSGAAPMHTGTEQTRATQAIQAADAHLEVSRCIIKSPPFRPKVMHDSDRFSLVAG